MKNAPGLIASRIPAVCGGLLLLGILALSVPGTALAQSGSVQPVQLQDETETEAEQRIRQGLQAILDGLGLFMRDIPRYEAPEILPNGDIIIRRINPKENAPDWKEDEAPFRKPDSTETGGKGKTI